MFEQHGASYADALRVAASIARDAGEIALRYHGTHLEVQHKPGAEPVTIADHECSALIVKRLAEAFPEDVVISEEIADDPRRLTARRVWYVDPIDGTKNFIRGEQSYCIMIGLCVAHTPTLGVIYQPNHDSMVFASLGGGSWSSRKGQTCRLRTSKTSALEDARLITSSVDGVADADLIRQCLGIRRAESIGSIGMKICTIALGGRDLYVNPATHCSSWDTCAPQIVLQEAGGRMSDLHGDELRYDAALTRHQRGLVASNGLLHDAVVASLAKVFPETSEP